MPRTAGWLAIVGARRALAALARSRSVPSLMSAAQLHAELLEDGADRVGEREAEVIRPSLVAAREQQRDRGVLGFGEDQRAAVAGQAERAFDSRNLRPGRRSGTGRCRTAEPRCPP